MNKDIIAESGQLTGMRFVMFDPDGNVVPIFCENFIGRWALRAMKKEQKTWLEEFLFGGMEKLPEKFPFGSFKQEKIVGEFSEGKEKKYSEEELSELKATASETCKKLLTN